MTATRQSKRDERDEVWREIDSALEEIARAARSDVSPADFYPLLLDHVVTALGGVGGAVLEWNRDRGVKLFCRNGPVGALFRDEKLPTEAHAASLQRVVDEGKPVRVLPGASLDSGGPPANPSKSLLLICPWRIADVTSGVVEILLAPGADPSAQRGYLEFLEVVQGLIVEFEKSGQMQAYGELAQLWEAFKDFSERVHRDSGVRPTAYEIANEGRRFVGCDRLSVVGFRGTRPRLLAVSGTDSLEPRANSVRRLELLTGEVVASGDPLVYPQSEVSLAPEIDQLVQDYLEETDLRAFAVVGLYDKSDSPAGKNRPIGALVVEQFQNNVDEQIMSRLRAIETHSARALDRAIEFESIPALGRALGRMRFRVGRARLLRIAIPALLVVAIVAAFCLIPADFRIQSRGTLQPVTQRHVFAPADGVVREIHVDHGTMVDEDTVVATLHKPDLEFEFRRLSGELKTAKTKLDTLQTERLQAESGGRSGSSDYSALVAQQTELSERISHLQRQQKILAQEKQDLSVKSPIDGQVISWNLLSNLDGRPVARGDVLMTIADVRGRWQIELELADRDAGHLIAASEEQGTRLPVSFVLASHPGAYYNGFVERIADSTDTDDAHLPIVRVLVRFSEEADEVELDKAYRPGTSARAWIDCGRKPLGYVWFRGVIDAVRSWLWL